MTLSYSLSMTNDAAKAWRGDPTRISATVSTRLPSFGDERDLIWLASASAPYFDPRLCNGILRCSRARCIPPQRRCGRPPPRNRRARATVPLVVARRIALLSSHHVGDLGFHLLKIHHACHQDSDHDGRRHEQHATWRAAGTRERPAKAFDHPRHRIQAIEGTPFSRHKRAWICNRRGEHPELHEKRHHVTYVAVDRVESREPQAHAQCRQDRKQQKNWQQQHCCSCVNSVIDHDGYEHQKRDAKIDKN